MRRALHYGADCPYLRGAEASSDTAMEEAILADMQKKLPLHGIPMPDIWLRLKPTNPFRRKEHALEAIEILKTRPDVDSVRHVNSSESRLCIINDDGHLEPHSPDWPKGRSVIRRNEFPETYQVFNLDVLRHENLAKFGSGYMGKSIHPIVGESITELDINNEDDFDLVKSFIEMRPRPAVVERHLTVPDAKPYLG